MESPQRDADHRPEEEVELNSLSVRDPIVGVARLFAQVSGKTEPERSKTWLPEWFLPSIR
jgi:hypothetical protein